MILNRTAVNKGSCILVSCMCVVLSDRNGCGRASVDVGRYERQVGRQVRGKTERKRKREGGKVSPYLPVLLGGRGYDWFISRCEAGQPVVW